MKTPARAFTFRLIRHPTPPTHTPTRYGLTMFGRLAVVSADGLALQFVLSVVVAVMELVFRATLIQREEWLRRRCSRAVSQRASILDSLRVREFYTAAIASEMMVEVSAIVTSGAIVLAFWHQRLAFDISFSVGQHGGLAVGSILATMAIQLALEFGVDLVSARFEARVLDLEYRSTPFRIAWTVAISVVVMWYALLAFASQPRSRICPQDDPCTCVFPLVQAACSAWAANATAAANAATSLVHF